MSFRSAALVFIFVVLAAAILGGCKPLCLNTRRDLQTIGTAPLGVAEVLAVAHERRPCTPQGAFGALPYPAGVVRWEPAPWMLDGFLTAGTINVDACVLDARVATAPTAPQAALAHEVAHWFWRWCFGRVGETITDSGRRIPDADLLQWTEAVNMEASRRLMLGR